MIVTDELRPELRPAVEHLLHAATEHDGVAALDEAARFALDGGTGERALHLLITAPDEASDSERVLGYASVLADGTVQGMVDPAARRRGYGRELLAAVLRERPDGGVWAHGALPAAVALLEGEGLEMVRELLTMRRPLGADASAIPVREPRDPAVELDAFDPSRDADDWVAVNARAFASHPEQGRLTRADLDERMAQPWFDAADLHVARRGGHLVGFVWVKREDGECEIYAVGTDPEAAGTGIAGALLSRALRALADAGADGADLYVEGDNTSAIGLYEHLGFTVSGRDLQFRRPRA